MHTDENIGRLWLHVVDKVVPASVGADMRGAFAIDLIEKAKMTISDWGRRAIFGRGLRDFLKPDQEHMKLWDFNLKNTRSLLVRYSELSLRFQFSNKLYQE